MKHAFVALGGALGATLAQWRPILILWLLGLGFAAAITAPWDAAVEGALDHLPQGRGLLEAASVEDFVDLLRVHAPALGAARAQAEWLSPLWILLCGVLFTGLAARMLDRKTHRSWLGAAGRYGFRSLVLLLTTGAALAALVPLNDLASTWTTRWLTGASHDAGAPLLGWGMTAKALVMLLLAGLVTTTGQLARVRVVAREERLALLSWLRTLGMLLRKPVRVGLMTVGLAQLLSLWPLVLLALLYDPGALASLVRDDGGWLGALREPWRAFVVLQLLQLGVIAALVYRLAVLVKLWPAVAPPLPAAPVPPAASDPPAAGSPPPPAAGVPAAATVAPAPASPSSAVLPPPAEQPLPDAHTAPEPPRDTADTPDGDGARGPGAATLALLLAIVVAAPLGAQDADPPPAEPGAPSSASPAATQDPAPADAPLPVAAAPAARAEPRAEPRADYRIQAHVDLAARTVTGREQATFLNTTSKPVAELWMHLYAAAFAHTDTQWQDDRSRATRRTAEDGGTIELRAVRLAADGSDLAERSVIRDTLLRVALPSPVPPGGAVTLDIEFVTRFPRIVARMGMTGAHLDGMQWYPKFAVHDESGWTAQPFHGTGEFFADFARYEVSFRYPTEHLGEAVQFEATGVPGEHVAGDDGTTRVTYRQADVHDFAFCADPAFERFTDTWESPTTGRSVELVYLCQPYAVPKAARVLEAQKSFLTDAARWWLEYPYDRLVIDGLPHSRGGGMEYPMLFTISQRQPNHLEALVELFEDPVSVTAHEFGHQYWYGILASNEVREAWLDEGLNTWSTARLEQSYFGAGGRTDLLTLLDRALTREVLNGAWRGRLPFAGRSLAAQNVVGWSRSPFHDLEPDPPSDDRKLLGFDVPGMDSWHLMDMQADRMAWMRTSYARDADARPLDTPSRDFTRGYGLVYRKTALVLETLRRHAGDAAMERVMRTYAQRFAFRHPTKDDFLGVVSEVTGGAHDAWMRALIETDDTLDVAVEDVVTRRRLHAGYSEQQRPGDPVEWREPPAAAERAERPWWERAWASVFRAPFPGAEAAPAPPEAADSTSGAPADATDADGEPAVWLCRWVVRRHGELPIPVEVEARFADGSVQRDLWTEPGGYRIYELESPSKLLSVRVDPERKIAVDLNRLNDGHHVPSDATTPAVLAEHGRFWAQSWLNGWLLAF